MRARKRFGQHFLEAVWADKVVAAIAPDPSDRFLEIGPGAGALTLRLAPRVGTLVAVEVDRDLAADLAPRLPAHARVFTGDFLEADLEALLGADDRQGWRVAGNLPYNITSPILTRLLELASIRRLLDATLMLQLEVAERVLARPGTGDYGPLAVLLQWYSDASRLLVLPPGAFRPPPRVHSALIRLRFRDPPLPLRNPRLFDRLTRAMFTRRRKTVANAIARFAASYPLAPAEALARARIDPRQRPETLEIIEIARLADVFAAASR